MKLSNKMIRHSTSHHPCITQSPMMESNCGNLRWREGAEADVCVSVWWSWGRMSDRELKRLRYFQRLIVKSFLLRLLLSKLKEISFSWHFISSSPLLSLRFALSHQHIKLASLSWAVELALKIRLGSIRFMIFLFSFSSSLLFFFLQFFLSSCAHQAKWKCRYWKVVVDTEITLRQKFFSASKAVATALEWIWRI